MILNRFNARIPNSPTQTTGRDKIITNFHIRNKKVFSPKFLHDEFTKE